MKKSRKQLDAEHAWHYRQLSPNEYTNYHNFHIAILEMAPGNFHVSVCSFFSMSEPAVNQFDTYEQALETGKFLVDSIRQEISQKAYRIDYKRL